jgi:hypothetical protein
VELIIGRSMEVDCNRHLLQGALVEETVAGWGHPMFRVTGGRQVVSTRMACPGMPPRRQFVTLGGMHALVPVNPKLPIVVVAPKELEVRRRLWPGPRPPQGWISCRCSALEMAFATALMLPLRAFTFARSAAAPSCRRRSARVGGANVGPARSASRWGGRFGLFVDRPLMRKAFA